MLTVASGLVTRGEAAAGEWLTESNLPQPPFGPNGRLAAPHALIYQWNATAVQGSVGWVG